MFGWKKKTAQCVEITIGDEILRWSKPYYGAEFEIQDEERKFADALGSELVSAGLSPQHLRLERMGDGGFNVFYRQGLYVGKIYLRSFPDKWAVKKPEATRTTKVFDNENDAQVYVTAKKGYIIDHRVGGHARYMQYLRGLYTIKDLDNPSLETCIDCIKYWITYIKKQSAAIKKALK